MIPDYKLYHGAVLIDLLRGFRGDLAITERGEEGRLCSYILNNCVALHIKHSQQRLNPWQFTFTKANVKEIFTLCDGYRSVFAALVCRTDGIVVLSADELTSLLGAKQSDQAWIRVSRRRREWYTVSGGSGELPYKKAAGTEPILSALRL